MREYYVSSDSKKINKDQAIELLRQTDWSKDRSKEMLLRAMGNSLCYGVFDKKDRMVGFARIITDYVTTFYLMDVVIDEGLRGQKLGTLLMDNIMEDLGHLYGILHTETARGFYEKYGFVVTGDSKDATMEKERRSLF